MTDSTIWNETWREAAWAGLEGEWDIIIIGGGITGAGILREATRLDLRTLLVEQRDFAWGTSSRSSKLVHGGLRYLKTGQVSLTRASVQGREQLLAEGPGLIDPLGFLLAQYEGDSAGRLVYGAGLSVYDLLALQWSHRYYSPHDFQMLAPYISPTGLRGGFQYNDAQTDDARLVLRLLRESVACNKSPSPWEGLGEGAATESESVSSDEDCLALNYVKAEALLRDDTGQVVGVRLRDMAVGSQASGLSSTQRHSPRIADVRARVVINATGAWADALREQAGAERRIRPLRGSHLIFPAWRFPVAQAVSFMHPIDGRPVFAFPWEGVTLVGTTDVDCPPPLHTDPCITADEVAYLMAAVTAHFPALSLTLDDIMATFAGIRPVIGSGKADPSDESRDHVIWQENGLLTVTGGKLTTFRQVARQALEAVCEKLEAVGERGSGGAGEMTESASSDAVSPSSDTRKRLALLHEDAPVLQPVDESVLAAISSPQVSLTGETRRRLLGRYGAEAAALVAAAEPDELEAIPGAPALWAELRWSARAEGVVHLDDLLLRRVRLGLLLPRGGADMMPRIRHICQPELAWDDARWETEEAAYRALIAGAYSLPPRETIPDWNALLAQSRAEQQTARVVRRERRQNVQRRAGLALLVLALLLAVAWLLRRKVPGSRGQVPGEEHPTLEASSLIPTP
ncbi:glycerol-3-phosphate dehydrogenase/oxidase [Promineifilum sp.]|uniref:glycerol-3-phosphate dehydrogenase/oxidase n=1 Tax=Promineifilum sp. TaxID=2664178 RepID=UPI0035AEA1DA